MPRLTQLAVLGLMVLKLHRTVFPNRPQGTLGGVFGRVPPCPTDEACFPLTRVVPAHLCDLLSAPPRVQEPKRLEQ